MPYNEGKYVCHLSPELQKLAEEQLNEDPSRREDSIKILREWIIKQPHINGRTDDVFLLKFLRHAKFSIEKAKQRIDSYYTMRTAIPEWFTQRDISNPKFVKLVKTGAFLPLGYDKEGRRVVLGRVGQSDPNEFSLNELSRLNNILTEWILFDEQTQICGIVFINDLSNMTGVHAAQFTPTVAKKAATFWQECMPIRTKAIHYWKAPKLFDAIFAMVKVFLKEKMLKRIQMHGSNVESLQSAFSKEILPQEYGGTGGTIEAIAERTLKDLLTYRDFFLDDEKYNVDESKRPGKPKTQEDLFGVDGSFRKLNID
ncbi:hypothetical protein CHUAL_007368 [Chamberlinius hualienensis]